jgi:GntR family transcriptional regulator
VDSGASSTRAILFDQTGEALAEGRHAYDVLRPHPGWVEQDADRWREALVVALRKTPFQKADFKNRFDTLPTDGENMANEVKRLIQDSFTPLYFQLKEIFLDKIENRELKEGDLVPSENQLQKIYGVSRATARKATQLLVNEGYLHKKKGKGTFVRQRKIEAQLPVLKSFTEEMSGRDASKTVISAEYIIASPVVSARLNLALHETVFSLKRLMVVDGKPLGILHSQIPAKYKLDVGEDYTRSLYRILEKKGIRLGEAKQTIEASMSTPEESSLMGLKTAVPTLVIRRLACSVNGEVVEYVKGVYHGDLYSYHCRLSRFA